MRIFARIPAPFFFMKGESSMKALRKDYAMLLTAVGLTMVLAVPSWAEDKKGNADTRRQE
jgi:hypothetical protein